MKREILSPAEMARYSRQMASPGWGRQAQERLKSSRVLIAGAGGLASSAALCLLASGVGALRLVDRSRVVLADLSQQSLYRECDLGKPKVAIAERRLKELNPFVRVEGQARTISEYNSSRLTNGCDLLIDATNNSSVGYLLNQAALRFRLPLIYARVWELNGRLAAFWPGQGPCLACAFPEVSDGGKEAGEESPLLGPISTIFGAMQALEAMRILGGLPPMLLGQLLTFEGKRFHFAEREIPSNPQCLVCRSLKTGT